MNAYPKNGFSLIELILAVALLITIGSMVTPFAGSFLQRVNLETTTTKVVSALHRTQANSLDGIGGADWQICLIGTTIRIFLGTCGTPTHKEDWTFPSTITVTGLNTTSFSRQRGEPSGALTINVSNAAGSRTITVNTAGGISE